METIIRQIETAYADRQNLSPTATPEALRAAIHEVIDHLNSGKLRVAEKQNGQWIVNAWVKMAVLLYFKTEPCRPFEAGYASFYDKIPMKFTNHSTSFAEAGVRVVPHAIVRYGAFLAPNTILMPSYINIGAYVDSGTLIDTWATIGSCAQIGKNVHVSGGAGIGGVLEPPQAKPTIIEDDCFIGARSEIVEGVIVEKGSVISMGVFIGQSTPIYNRETDEISYGRIPAGSVVISGGLPSNNGKYQRYAAIIVKQVDEKTRGKVSLNELLREGLK